MTTPAAEVNQAWRERFLDIMRSLRAGGWRCVFVMQRANLLALGVPNRLHPPTPDNDNETIR